MGYVSKIKRYSNKTELHVKAVLILIFVIFSGCIQNFEVCIDWDYENCNTTPPETTFVTADLTINSEHSYVIVKLFQGYWDQNVLLREDTVFSNAITYEIQVGQKYSMSATYRKGDMTIVAIDGGMSNAVLYQVCESHCYRADELFFNLRID